MSKKRKKKRKPSIARGAEPEESTPAPQAPSESPAYHAVTGPWLLHILFMVVLVAGTCLLYQPDLDLGFFHVDDASYVTLNPWIQGATGEHVRFILTQPYAANFSPMHLFSYMVDHAIGELDPHIYHLSSNLWAGVAAAMLYLVGLVLLGSPLAAFVAALLFVVHPAHVEAVAWISSRKDLVAATFALPSLLTYFFYRRGGRRARAWYVVSLAFFLLAVAGKLSVVVLPGIFFVFDLFVERRRDRGMFLDKLPHALIVLVFALRVMAAQPSTRHHPELFVLGHSALQFLVLATGFGEYVMHRPRPSVDVAAHVALFFRCLPLLLLALPLAFWRKGTRMVASLLYWMVFAFIPPMVLSFVYPVTDRYLFFPSAAFTLLLAWGIVQAGKRWGRGVLAAGFAIAFVIGTCWAHSTRSYLGEWNDPRSVWYAATRKSDDVRTHQYLGTHYQDLADQLTVQTDNDTNRRTLARLLWEEDERLEKLLAEWDAGELVGPSARAYQRYVRDLAAEELRAALARKGTRLVPNLYFRLGKLAMDEGRYDEAAVRFEEAVAEARNHTSQDVKNELIVRSTHALGLVRWRQRNYADALRHVHEAEAEQQRVNGRWIPNIAQHRQQLERLAR